MRSMEETPNVVRYLLLQSTAVTSLVAQRISANKADQAATFPFIIYRRTNADFVNSKDGNSGLARLIVEVEIYTNNYDSLLTLAAAARRAIDNNRGVIDNHDIKLIQYEATRDQYQDAAEYDGVHMLQQDYLIFANTN